MRGFGKQVSENDTRTFKTKVKAEKKNQIFMHFSFSLSKKRKTALKEANSENKNLYGNRTQSTEPGLQTSKRQ
jgi:hypothetical protein